MITEEIIRKIYPTLDSKWERTDITDRRRADGNRYATNVPNPYDIWQQAKGHLWEVVNVLNELENVDDLTLLDFGCDVGLHSIVATQKFKKVVGIDVDEISYRRSKVTKDIFMKEGYDVSNFEVKNIDFHSYIKGSHFDNDNITALLKSDVGSSSVMLESNSDKELGYAMENVELVIWTVKQGMSEKAADERKKLIEVFKKFSFVDIKTYFDRRIYVGRKNE
jgi:hypothetical protein